MSYNYWWIFTNFLVLKRCLTENWNGFEINISNLIFFSNLSLFLLLYRIRLLPIITRRIEDSHGPLGVVSTKMLWFHNEFVWPSREHSLMRFTQYTRSFYFMLNIFASLKQNNLICKMDLYERGNSSHLCSSLSLIPVERDNQDQIDKTVVTTLLAPAVQLLQEGLDLIAIQQPHPCLENGMQNWISKFSFEVKTVLDVN